VNADSIDFVLRKQRTKMNIYLYTETAKSVASGRGVGVWYKSIDRFGHVKLKMLTKHPHGDVRHKYS
jgi:hypothetical protein